MVRQSVTMPIIPPARTHVVDLNPPVLPSTNGVDRVAITRWLDEKARKTPVRPTDKLVLGALYEALAVRLRRGDFDVGTG